MPVGKLQVPLQLKRLFRPSEGTDCVSNFGSPPLRNGQTLNGSLLSRNDAYCLTRTRQPHNQVAIISSSRNTVAGTDTRAAWKLCQ